MASALFVARDSWFVVCSEMASGREKRGMNHGPQRTSDELTGRQAGPLTGRQTLKKTMSYTIFIVDDHDIIREGLKAILRRQPDYEVIGEAEDGQEALEKIGSLKPDI
ncbi:MAG: response regulator transcription factor, partial [Candidatus Omnitrophica bacterium]|nr:response regulator transcription factor [Candidatus Omnitrophota bacterium]